MYISGQKESHVVFQLILGTGVNRLRTEFGKKLCLIEKKLSKEKKVKNQFFSELYIIYYQTKT